MLVKLFHCCHWGKDTWAMMLKESSPEDATGENRTHPSNDVRATGHNELVLAQLLIHYAVKLQLVRSRATIIQSTEYCPIDFQNCFNMHHMTVFGNRLFEKAKCIK